MNIVYLVQAGDTGGVKIGNSTERGLPQHINALQRGNEEILAIRKLYDGDERLERALHVRLAEHHKRGDWYCATVLDDLPGDLPELPHDTGQEERRQASIELQELARIVR